MKPRIYLTALVLALAPAAGLAETPPKASETKDIKAYCLDFNWAATGRKRKPFAAPGTWAASDPAQHVAWYKAIGTNVIETFCVSSNGYHGVSLDAVANDAGEFVEPRK